jgi:hypothetical protein
MLHKQGIDRANQLTGVPQHRKDITLFEGFMKLFYEVVDDVGAVVDGGYRYRLSGADAVKGRLVDQENPLEDTVLLHQIDIWRVGARRGRGLGS